MIHEETRALDPAAVVRGAAVRAVAGWIALPLFFLAAGGSLRWWEAWVYCLALLVPMTVFLAHMARRDPQFLARRMRLRERERAQRRIIAWGTPLLLAALIVSGLDHRFGWSHPSVVVVAVAMVVVLAGYLLILRVFLENRWAGRTIETYPGQEVVSTGPYRLVRHPMYAGGVALYLATPVALGSWWALIPALMAVSVFVPRIRNEEEVLVRELPGYEEYRHKVPYRLAPFVW